MTLSTFDRLNPRLAKLQGKVIPYSKLRKILLSLPNVYVDAGDRMFVVWVKTPEMDKSLVAVESVYERTGLQTSYLEPIMKSVVVKIRVVAL